VSEWLRAQVRKPFAAPWYARTERSVFGELDADAIVDAVDAACSATFGSGLADGFLYVVSVGCVIGCRLDDGRELVLKAYQQRWTPDFLAAVKRVQLRLHDSGFPCPRPIDVDLTVGSAHVLAEDVLPDPGPDPATKDALNVSARGLAQLVSLCRGIDEPALALHPLRAPNEGVFPEPHSPIFDFDATRDGAEWIEELARRAMEIRNVDSSPPVIAHTDWSLRNVRLGATAPVAVYDWDSLALVRESESVAFAAVTWCKTGEGDDHTPTVDEIEEYIDVYESARGTPFSEMQRKAARAAAVGTMAYTARCEHSVDPTEQVWTTTRPRLRSASEVLLR